MLVVAGLTVANGLSQHAQGTGLSPYWLLLLLLPGAASAQLSRRHIQGQGNGSAALPLQGLRAGVVTAHFVAPLLVSLLIIAVATIDWTTYTMEVGNEVAPGVSSAVVPATSVFALVAVVLAYSGCALAGLLGGSLYMLGFECYRKLLVVGC